MVLAFWARLLDLGNEKDWKHPKNSTLCHFPFLPEISLIFGRKMTNCPAYMATCQLLNGFPTLPDIHFVHKRRQPAELPSRESI